MLRKSWMQMIFIANVYQARITWFLILVSHTNMGSKMPHFSNIFISLWLLWIGMLFMFNAPVQTRKEPLAIPEVKTHKQLVGTQQRGHQGRRNLFGSPATLMCTCYVIHTTWLGPTWQLYRKLISWLGLLFALPYRKFTISGLPSSRLRYGWNEIWYWCRSALAHET